MSRKKKKINATGRLIQLISEKPMTISELAKEIYGKDCARNRVRVTALLYRLRDVVDVKEVDGNIYYSI